MKRSPACSTSVNPLRTFSSNSRELVLDALTGWDLRASLVLRVLNAECDALVNSAHITQELSFSPSVLPPSVHLAWRTVMVEFSRRFTRLAGRSG